MLYCFIVWTPAGGLAIGFLSIVVLDGTPAEIDEVLIWLDFIREVDIDEFVCEVSTSLTKTWY